jgi:sugar lactone lactonase YvrE
MDGAYFLLGAEMTLLDPLLDLFRGQAVTIPPLDGALKPNTLIDDAEVMARAEAPDNLVDLGGRLVFTSGKEVRSVAEGEVIWTAPAGITALAASPDGELAAGLESGGVQFSGKLFEGFNCPVALAFASDGTLYVCNGSDAAPPSGWKRDLMSKGAGGSVWRVDPRSGERQCLAKTLGFPYGVVVDETKGRVLVSESWRHRIVAIPMAGGAVTALLTKLPGYPARLAARPGGYIMSLFAPRNRLIEFVLLEDDYRAAMMSEIESQFWIAPSLSPSRNFLEPLQNGGVRVMGIHKPWSPTRSYGLVVALDASLQPITSFHSRANGARHGVTSAVAQGKAIIAAAKGGDIIVKLAASTGDA